MTLSQYDAPYVLAVVTPFRFTDRLVAGSTSHLLLARTLKPAALDIMPSLLHGSLGTSKANSAGEREGAGCGRRCRQLVKGFRETHSDACTGNSSIYFICAVRAHSVVKLHGYPRLYGRIFEGATWDLCTRTCRSCILSQLRHQS